MLATGEGVPRWSVSMGASAAGAATRPAATLTFDDFPLALVGISDRARGAGLG